MGGNTGGYDGTKLGHGDLNLGSQSRSTSGAAQQPSPNYPCPWSILESEGGIFSVNFIFGGQLFPFVLSLGGGGGGRGRAKASTEGGRKLVTRRAGDAGAPRW